RRYRRLRDGYRDRGHAHRHQDAEERLARPLPEQDAGSRTCTPDLCRVCYAMAALGTGGDAGAARRKPCVRTWHDFGTARLLLRILLFLLDELSKASLHADPDGVPAHRRVPAADGPVYLRQVLRPVLCAEYFLFRDV